MSTIEAEKTYQDGNHETVPASEVVVLDGREPWAIDSEGSELREGDHVLVLSTRDDFGKEWRGALAVVGRVATQQLYETSGKALRGLHHVSAEKAVSLERVTYPAHSSWAIPGKFLRRVDLDTDEGKRLTLADALARRSMIDTYAAKIESDRVVVSLEIRRLREDLGDVE